MRETGSVKPELVEPPSDPLLGLTIAGKYRLDAKIGAGGMGAVYRATRLLIGDEVAVKILHSEQNDPRAADRFHREAQAAARLKHPNAVVIYDFGVTEDGLQYLVMELVEGESLRQIIKQQGPITPLTAAEILTQVCAALDEAHRNNIIHRDIKPDNIIVNSLVTGLRVKVLDFGIAKLRDDAVSSLTQTGNVLGTPHYMSPEQCLGEELDNRSDIYSLGVVLYEMLTGGVPFKGTIDEQKNFSIDELDAKGAPIGTFKGRFTSETEVEGKWSKPNGKNLMDFSLKDEGETSNGGNYVVQSKVFAKKAGGTKTRMSYPQIDGLSDARIQSDFNDRIRAFVNKNAGGSSDEGEGTQTGSFSIDYRSPDLLTVMFSVGIDWEGAAHPNSYNFSYNYDLQHGRALELRDFFLPGSNYLSVVAKLCAREVAIEKRNNGMADIYEDGEAAASDALKQDATFYPTKTALVFVFDPYQVGSYAEGYYVVSIPYSQLKSIINAEGPLAPFVG